jgi:hypothetical protein
LFAIAEIGSKGYIGGNHLREHSRGLAGAPRRLRTL